MAKRTLRTIAGDPYRDDREVLRLENERLRRNNQHLWRLVKQGFFGWCDEQVQGGIDRLRVAACLAWEFARLPALLVIALVGMLSVGSITLVGFDRLAEAYGADVYLWLLRMTPPSPQALILRQACGGKTLLVEADRQVWWPGGRRLVWRSHAVMALPVDRNLLAAVLRPFTPKVIAMRAEVLFPPRDLEYVEVPLVGLITLVGTADIEVAVGEAEAIQELGDNS